MIIGTDIPDITPAHIAQAFRALGRTDCVFGRATDGGYWLVGPGAGRGRRGHLRMCAGRASMRSPTRWPTSPADRSASSPP